MPEKCPDDEDLKEIRNRLETARKDAKPESGLMIDDEIKAVDNLLKLREMLNQLSQLRENGEYDDYSLQTSNIIAVCTEKEMCSYSLSLIDKQKHNSDEELDVFFAEEENQLKNALNAVINSEDAPEARIITMNDVIHESGKESFFSSIMQSGAVAQDNGIKSGLLHICEKVFDTLRNAMEHIADIVSEKISLFRKIENPQDKTENSQDKTEQEEKNTSVDKGEKSEKDETCRIELYGTSAVKWNGYIDFIGTDEALKEIGLQTGLLLEQKAVQEQEHLRPPEQVKHYVSSCSVFIMVSIFPASIIA